MINLGCHFEDAEAGPFVLYHAPRISYSEPFPNHTVAVWGEFITLSGTRMYLITNHDPISGEYYNPRVVTWGDLYDLAPDLL